MCTCRATRSLSCHRRKTKSKRSCLRSCSLRSTSRSSKMTTTMKIAVPAGRPSGMAAGRERASDAGGLRTTGASTTGAGPSTGNDRRATPSMRRGESEGGVPSTPSPTHGGTHSGSTGGEKVTTGNSRAAEDPSPPPDLTPTPLSSGSYRAAEVAQGASLPTVLGPGDSLRVVARAIASRTTGSLCLAHAEGERRIVLREGDVVTTASTAEDESLLAFLGVRGDLPRETVRRLGTKFPPFGRLAGAALVARGYLRQDQMWAMLRAHAEWLLTRALQTPDARLAVEPKPPGRLAGEPSVFGGSTGASVLVEIVRRIVPPAEAIERMGGLVFAGRRGPGVPPPRRVCPRARRARAGGGRSGPVAPRHPRLGAGGRSAGRPLCSRAPRCRRGSANRWRRGSGIGRIECCGGCDRCGGHSRASSRASPARRGRRLFCAARRAAQRDWLRIASSVCGATSRVRSIASADPRGRGPCGRPSQDRREGGGGLRHCEGRGAPRAVPKGDEGGARWPT